MDKNKRLQIGVVAVSLIGLFLLAVGGGLFLFKGFSTANDDIQIITGVSDTVSEKELIVHVDGAVVTPGVFRLSSDSRVTDAVSVAGGLTEDADRSRINLAAKLADGQKIYVLAIGEQLGSSVVGSSIAGQSISSLININIASESELDKLPGIGPVTAQKIIAARPYSALEDLLAKKAVNRSTYEKIKDLVTVY